jgi:hypothetical protein
MAISSRFAAFASGLKSFATGRRRSGEALDAVGLTDGERGEDDADADIGLEGFLLASPPDLTLMSSGGDTGRLTIVGVSESSEEEDSSETTSSDVYQSELLPVSILFLRELLSVPSMSVLS